MVSRTGSAAVLLVIAVVAVGVGALAMSPDTAQEVLPPQMLPMLPQFEAVDTSRNCGTIEEGTEFWNSLPLEDVTKTEARRFFCMDKCGGKQQTAGGYCRDGTLSCACRKGTGTTTGQ